MTSMATLSKLRTRASLRRIADITRLSATENSSEEDEEHEEHLNGIGVGIDLGTTNSAVAMMIPTANNDGRTQPAMIEIENEGRTIPSVVALVPVEESLDDDHSPSLPPWAPNSSPTLADIQWPSGHPHFIQIGKRAIEYEQHHPESSFRNVKRVMGTGGKMAELASGVVPNLFIQSVNGNKFHSFDSFDSLDSLDAAFDMLEKSTKPKKGKKKKNKKKKQHVSKWKKRKEGELPKLHKQLEQARDDPALLACNMNPPSTDDANTMDATTTEEVLLRPEQISACILRKLYDTAERDHRRRNGDASSAAASARVTRAVIGVPAYFTESQRRATIRASELAGVPKVKLLPEPEAAALAYGAASDEKAHLDEEEELILVFDLGGGTFDVSVLEVGGGVTEVLATVGNNRLGGTDFDKRVAEHLSGEAVEFGRKRAKAESKKKKKKVESLDGLEEAMVVEKETGRKRMPVKDWYREGKGEVPDIILRVAEEARKCLSNQKVVEVLVPLTEEGWRTVGGNSDDSDDNNNNNNNLSNVIGPFDKTKLESQQNMIEDIDYTIITLDRKTFEMICSNELQMLLQPIREVAIMAGVLLPGEARPSFVENAMAMASARREEDGEDFWDFENEDDLEEDDENEPILMKTGKDGASATKEEEEVLNEQALQQIQAMDVKAQKKAQQRGRKKARDITKRERSFRKQKQSAMEEATTASLLGTQLDGSSKNKRRGNASSSSQPAASAISVGNERVQEGIHGRPLSRIVLVGGATRTPAIAKLLEALVGMVPQRTVHPDEAVALGCAVQAGILDGENDGLAGGMQAVLSPMQAAVMRALAKKRGLDDEMLLMEGGRGGGGDVSQEEMEMMMMGGGGISGMMVVDEFDDEDDFY